VRVFTSSLRTGFSSDRAMMQGLAVERGVPISNAVQTMLMTLPTHD
jgi:hypothetical protein